MPVHMIAKFTELTIRQVRESLVVLIQQNLAVYAETQEKTRITTYYEVNRVEILHRAVIPKVLFSTQEWFEREGGMVSQSILTHGKLTIKDCVADILKTTGTAAGRSTTQRKLQENGNQRGNQMHFDCSWLLSKESKGWSIQEVFLQVINV